MKYSLQLLLIIILISAKITNSQDNSQIMFLDQPGAVINKPLPVHETMKLIESVPDPASKTGRMLKTKVEINDFYLTEEYVYQLWENSSWKNINSLYNLVFNRWKIFRSDSTRLGWNFMD